MKFYLTVAALILAAHASLAQLPKEISVVWGYSPSQNDTSRFVSGNFVFLKDSTVAFLTTEYADVARTTPVAYYFSKLSLSGSLLVDRQRIQLPSVNFKVTGFKATGSGDIAVLALKPGTVQNTARTRTDSAWLAQFDPSLNLLWGKYVFTGNPGPFDARYITGFETIDNGGFIILQRGDGVPNGVFGYRGGILSLDAHGDSVYFKFTEGYIDDIRKVAYSNLYITYETIPFDIQRLYARTCQAASQSIQIRYDPVFYPSNFIYLSDYSAYFYVTTYKEALNNFSMQIIDENLNPKGHIDYPDASNLFYYTARLVKDDSKGLYAWNDFATYPYGSPLPDDYYFGLCRLDSTGKVRWSFRVDKPQTTLGGAITDLFPLDGDDFLAVLTRPAGATIYRLSRSSEVADRSTAIQKAAGMQLLNQTNASEFSVTIGNNPSTSYFSITTNSDGHQPIELTVSDASGRVIEKKAHVNTGESMQIGANYKPGVYFLQVVQGQQRKTVQLIKQ